MSNLTVENVYTRQNARALAKKHFWKLLGMTLIIAAITLGIMFAGMSLLGITSYTAVSSIETAMASGNVSAAFTIGYLVLMLVITLVSGGLSLGMNSALIDLCRGDESVTVGRVFSRMGQCLKALGLSLWVGLKTFLWMLPGYALLLVGLIVAASAESEALGVLIPLGSIILIFALVIPAAYRYLLSTYILADKPETGVFACVRESKELMKGHKWQAFKLVIPVILILYLLVFLFSLVASLLAALLAEISSVLGAIVTIVLMVAMLGLSLFFAFRISFCYCIFYLNRQNEVVTIE